MPDFDAVTRLLDAAEASAPVDAVDAVTREIGARLHARSVDFLIADTSGRALVRMTHRPDGADSTSLVPLDGGPHERVVRGQQLEVVPPGTGDGWTVLAPVTERGEAVGVLELVLPAEPGLQDVREIGSLAHLLAFVVVANRRHTDLFEWGQRTRPLSLSAEIQQRLLPSSRTCEAGAFTLSGWLEPAADIAGDTFDYSLGRDALHLSMTDAMGHGVGAALTATLCVGAMRGARRQASTLREQALAANRAVAEHSRASGMDDFVTGMLGRVDLTTGELHLVNAGHVPPYLARGSEVAVVDLHVNLPLGMFEDSDFAPGVLALEPGDRLVLVTDGMLERNAADLDLPSAIAQSRTLHPREAVAALADSVLAATGHALSDDATVLCLDWYGDHGQERTTTAGADVTRATRVSG